MDNKENVILCAASAYEEKYYFNSDFNALPDYIKNELQILCVIFTKECGGIISLEFNEEKELIIKTEAKVGDYRYDEISAGMLIGQLRREKEELFQALERFYKYYILREFETE